MSDPTLRLRRATAVDALSYVETLLAENDLPSADVRSTPEAFYVADVATAADVIDVAGVTDVAHVDDSECGGHVGVGGVEVHGTDGLLRSVVVERSLRGHGFGRALCEALEREARAAGVDTLYLLTTTAREFFADRGFVEVDRTDAPAAIQATSQFTDRCPTTAACLRKSL
jgi:amino-acid N-acetyltransferase